MAGKLESARWRAGYTAIRLIAGLQLCLAVVISDSAAADWSFERYPQPDVTEFGPMVDELLDRYMICDVRLTTAYFAYQFGHPDFEQQGRKTERYHLWTRHISEFTDGYLASCVVTEISDQLHILLDLAEDLSFDFLFCGVFAGPPSNALVEEISRLMGALIEHGELGNHNAVRKFLSYHFFRDAVRLSPTLEYFIRKTAHLRSPDFFQYFYVDLAKKDGDYDNPIHQENAARYDHLTHLKRLSAIIDPTMVSLLDRAVDEKDLSAVLATINDCDGL
jgi:hypothetical protein